MMLSCRIFIGDEFHSQLFGALSPLPQHPLAEAFLEVVLTLIGVFLATGQHHVDQPRQLMRGSGHRFGFIHARTHAPEVGA